jgi:DNA replication protein DnaC
MKTSNPKIPMKKLHDPVDYLRELQLIWPCQNYEKLAQQAARENWSHLQFLSSLLEGECLRRRDNRTVRRIRQARFPVIKTLDSFDWSWPKKINRLQIQDLFRLAFIKEKTNVIFMGGVGLGKTHLAAALGYAACLQGYSVLFASAIDMINSLAAAQAAQRLKYELKKYLAPQILQIDELGYLPIDKQGADLLFQVISQRYECGPIVLTTNKPYKTWPAIFNNDSTLTSAVLDRLLHHNETILIDGSSYRMKEKKYDP